MAFRAHSLVGTASDTNLNGRSYGKPPKAVPNRNSFPGYGDCNRNRAGLIADKVIKHIGQQPFSVIDWSVGRVLSTNRELPTGS